MLWVKHLSPAGSQCPSVHLPLPPPPANPAAPLPTSAQDPSRDQGDGLCRSLASELGNGRWMFLRKACWKFSRGLDDHLPIRSKWSPSNILCRYWDPNICSLGRHGCELPGMSWQKKSRGYSCVWQLPPPAHRDSKMLDTWELKANRSHSW